MSSKDNHEAPTLDIDGVISDTVSTLERRANIKERNSEYLKLLRSFEFRSKVSNIATSLRGEEDTEIIFDIFYILNLNISDPIDWRIALLKLAHLTRIVKNRPGRKGDTKFDEFKKILQRIAEIERTDPGLSERKMFKQLAAEKFSTPIDRRREADRLRTLYRNHMKRIDSIRIPRPN